MHEELPGLGQSADHMVLLSIQSFFVFLRSLGILFSAAPLHFGKQIVTVGYLAN